MTSSDGDDGDDDNLSTLRSSDSTSFTCSWPEEQQAVVSVSGMGFNDAVGVKIL